MEDDQRQLLRGAGGRAARDPRRQRSGAVQVRRVMPDAVDRLFQSHRIRDCLLREAELMGSAFWADATIRYGACPEWATADLLHPCYPVAGACAPTPPYL